MHRTRLVLFVLSSFVPLLGWSAPMAAQEFSGVELMRPDSLIGWDHGNPPPQGWTMADGRLGGSADSTPLLSGFTAGPFEIRLRWSVSDAGAWKVSLPEVPDGPGLAIVLCEGESCGRLTDGDKELAPGAKVEPLAQADAMHTAAIRRTADKLALMVDDRQLWEVDVRAERRFGLGLAVTAGRGSMADLRGAEPLGEPVFNGRDLAGWWTQGNLGKWTIEDGEVVRQEGAGDYLRSEKEYGNFTLSMQYKMRKGGNSGLGIRTPRRGWPSSDGMELQWLGGSKGLSEYDNLSIYGNVPALAPPPEDIEQWNSLVVKADGYMISAWLNGQLAQQCNTWDHPELKHRNLAGWIGLQDHGAWLRVRDVRVLEAPAGRGLDAW